MAQSPIGHTVVTTANDLYPIHVPGELIEMVDSSGLKRFKYIKYNKGSGSISAVAGNICYYLDGTDFNGYEVTSDVSDTDINQVAGVLQNVITDEYYGWIQTWGYYATIKTNGDDDIAASDALIGAGDGTCNSVAQDTAPTNKLLGWAVAADVDASDTVAGYITIE